MERRKFITLAACIAAVFFFACASVADEKKVIEEDYHSGWFWDLIACYSKDKRFDCNEKGYSNVKVYAYRSEDEGRVLIGEIRNAISGREQYVYLRYKGEWQLIGVIELKDNRRDAYYCFAGKGKVGDCLATYYEANPPFCGSTTLWQDVFDESTKENRMYPPKQRKGSYFHNIIPQVFFWYYRNNPYVY